MPNLLAISSKVNIFADKPQVILSDAQPFHRSISICVNDPQDVGRTIDTVANRGGDIGLRWHFNEGRIG